jgi:hypothetical protein
MLFLTKHLVPINGGVPNAEEFQQMVRHYVNLRGSDLQKMHRQFSSVSYFCGEDVRKMAKWLKTINNCDYVDFDSCEVVSVLQNHQNPNVRTTKEWYVKVGKMNQENGFIVFDADDEDTCREYVKGLVGIWAVLGN